MTEKRTDRKTQRYRSFLESKESGNPFQKIDFFCMELIIFKRQHRGDVFIICCVFGAKKALETKVTIYHI